MRAALLAACALGLAACVNTPPPDANAPAVIAAQLDRFLAGVSAGDPTVHSWWWADDLVYTSSSGARFGKATILDGASQPPDPVAQPVRYTAEAVQVRVYGDTAALAFRLVALQGDTRSEYLNSATLRLADANWQVVQWQATRSSGDTGGD